MHHNCSSHGGDWVFEYLSFSFMHVILGNTWMIMVVPALTCNLILFLLLVKGVIFSLDTFLAFAISSLQCGRVLSASFRERGTCCAVLL